MKRHHHLLALSGLILCCLTSLHSAVPFKQDPCDYQHIDSPIPEKEIHPSANLFDFDRVAQDFILETKKIEIPGHPMAFNPSILRWKGSLLMSFRTYDERTGATNPFGLIWLDESFTPVGNPQLFELPFKNPVLQSKQQDPRLISVGERLFLVYNNILESVIHREMRRMFLVEIFWEGDHFTASEPRVLEHFEGENDNRYEKNWVPFEYNGQLHLSYSIIPHRVFRPQPETNSCETLYSTKKTFKWDWGMPRGGTQAIVDGDHYLAFFHSWIDTPTVQSSGKKITHYVMGAYTFDARPPFSLIAASPEPIVADNFYQPPFYKTWKPLRCVFPAGLLIDGDTLWVAYGRQDHEVWITKIDKKRLLDSLVPIPSDSL